MGVVLFSLPAGAANLERWRFDADQNRLIFNTDETVQPRVQLIANPTRLVIDLPDTQLQQAPIEEPGSGRIHAIRIGQLDGSTARIVIELEAGYTIDPRAVRVRSSSSTQWIVQLPDPEPITQSETGSAPEDRLTQVETAASIVQDLRITPDGFFIQLTGEPDDIDRDNDRRPRRFTLELEDAALSPDIVQRDIPLNQHGVSRIRLTQEMRRNESIVKIMLELEEGSPNWQVNDSQFGGISLNPERGRVLSRGQISRSLTATSSPLPVPSPPVPAPGMDSATSPIPLPDVSDSQIVVAIDPGHGGHDPGAVGIGGLQEAGIVLDIGLQVARLLEEKGVRVILTRQDDREIDLEPRVRDANRANADLFVSIHANAINLSRPDVNGLETYYYSDSGARLARVIHNAVLRLTGSPDRGVHYARFYVLRHTSMPAVLVETGFVTGAEDAQKLNDPAFRTRMAEAIAAGILEYIQQTF
jgi:N-acetylmuramoyl-L-alanine amidase